MTNHRNKQNYRFRTLEFRDRYHLRGGVCVGTDVTTPLTDVDEYFR